ncbi:hypothetical protein [Rhodoferax ferrireducens]|nr:hypothetical protein [Rhodoferax ferrireducens]
MKSKTTLLMAATLLFLSVMDIQAHTIVLEDGSTPSVLRQKGTVHSYIKEVKPGADGRMVIYQGQVFDGESLVKISDGQCLTVLDHLVSLDIVSIGDAKIQRPNTTRESKAASCNS